jgi:predicted nucleic acid-binding Zn ribbon protein
MPIYEYECLKCHEVEEAPHQMQTLFGEITETYLP